MLQPHHAKLNSVDDSNEAGYVFSFEKGLPTNVLHCNWVFIDPSNLYSPAVAVLVIFKVDFTIFIHYCRFWSLAPNFNEFPIVLQHNKQDSLFIKQSWNQLPTINIHTYHLFYYLKKERPKDVHVVSANGPSISDTSGPPVQQLSGVYASFSLVWRHQQVTLNLALQVVT